MLRLTEQHPRSLWFVIALIVFNDVSAFAQKFDESQWPPEPTPAVVPDESQLPAATPNAASALPDEGSLPSGQPREAETQTVLSPGTLRPWLRLRFDGHTGTIRALAISSDATHLLSAGEDKDLHVWSRQFVDEKPRNWFHRRTIRWPIERGPLGRIYALAVHGNQVAIAGHGACGAMGEIWVVDLTTGNLLRSHVDTEHGHRQPVGSLVWQPSDAGALPTGLVSIDAEGLVLLWRPDAATGIWSATTLVATDTVTYGTEIAGLLAPRRRLLPLAFLGSNQLLVPTYVGATEQEGLPKWQLKRMNLSTGQSDMIAVDQLEMVTAMTTTSEGRNLACSDATGKLSILTFDDQGKLLATQTVGGPRRVALALAFAENGKRLAVATNAASNDNSPPSSDLEWFDTSAPETEPKRLSSISLTSHAWGVQYDPLANQLLALNANQIQVHPLVNEQLVARPSQVLAPRVGAINKVSFINAAPPYKIELEAATTLSDPAAVNQFDLTAVKLEPLVDANVKAIDANAAKANFDIRFEDSELGAFHFLYKGDDRQGMFPLRPELHGTITSTAWFEETKVESPEAQSDRVEPPGRTAVAVGTDGRNNVYVYELNVEAQPKLLRQFRGHAGAVLSIGASSDQRYLISGSDDATVCAWKLEDVFTATETTNRWGCEFEIEGERLFATKIRRDGPLYFRGVREGDQLLNISWFADDAARAEADPAKMQAALATMPFDSLVAFYLARLGRPREGFQSFPAWHPVATLFVDQSRQWAFWTPAGFYDASFGGNELFGWQINRGVNALPDYFRAAQFRQRLENPPAMRRLLATGDLATALEKGLGGIAPPPGEAAIVNQILSKPVIRLLQPAVDQTLVQAETTIEAAIDVPLGSVLQPPKAFAGGVPAINRVLRLHTVGDGHETYRYTWTARLPCESQLPLDVIAATDGGATDRVSLDLKYSCPSPQRTPRMFFLSLGISRYADPQIQPLDFAARGAGVMSQLFRKQTKNLYRTTTSELLDRDAIRPLWRDYAAEAARELALDVAPDDLVVMYLCGHGIRDRRTNQWYFVTADARYNDLMNDRYDDLLSFNDLAMLGELPCRKLAIIDSCHSGAVQPTMRSDDLKAALRWLQGDVVFTVTASEGDEEAAEQKDRQLGRFTAQLVDALQGSGDLDHDGIVTLREAITSVKQASAEESRISGFVQHPTAGPAELLESQTVRLTRVGG